MNKEIEKKGKEILRVRSDATRELRLAMIQTKNCIIFHQHCYFNSVLLYRIREEELTEQHAEDIEQLNGKHSEQTQKILEDFTSAQAILKEKISELSLL